MTYTVNKYNNKVGHSVANVKSKFSFLSKYFTITQEDQITKDL